MIDPSGSQCEQYYLVGDALDLGPHWYYDLEEQVRDYGEWIDDYTDPQPERYHAGSEAGDYSQQGILMLLTAHSLIDDDCWCITSGFAVLRSLVWLVAVARLVAMALPLI